MTVSPLAIVASPGILARCEQQHRPLWLERFADKVVYNDYVVDDFSGGFESYALADEIDVLRGRGYRVLNFGSSLGGNVATFASNIVLKTDPDADEWLDTIVVDAPFGAGTLKQVPVSAGMVTSKAGTVGLKAFAPLLTSIGRTKIGLPKDSEITLPDADILEHLVGHTDLTHDQWKYLVKQEAKSGLTGHSTTAWRQHIQWMCRVGADGSLKKALESMYGHNFTYVQCTLGNGVVDQPGAQQLHQAYAGFGSGPNRVPRLFTVKAPHCAYLQMQPQFEEVLVPRLRMLA